MTWYINVKDIKVGQWYPPSSEIEHLMARLHTQSKPQTEEATGKWWQGKNSDQFLSSSYENHIEWEFHSREIKAVRASTPTFNIISVAHKTFFFLGCLAIADLWGELNNIPAFKSKNQESV